MRVARPSRRACPRPRHRPAGRPPRAAPLRHPATRQPTPSMARDCSRAVRSVLPRAAAARRPAAVPEMGECATWRALGSTVRVVVEGGDIGRARSSVADLLDLVDRTYSRFRPDSELSRVNARAEQSVPNSPLLAWTLDAALRAARLSQGLVDPTVGHAMRLTGYDRDFSRMNYAVLRTDAPVMRLEPVPGWQSVELDRATPSVRIAPGVEIDLGSIGKAFAADLAASAALGASGARGALVSLGGDIAVA